jgi:hypothetical protein
MSRQQKMHFGSGLLRVDASGDFSLEDAKQGFLEILEAVAQHKAEKILLDARTVKGKPQGHRAFLLRRIHRERNPQDCR